MKRVSSTVLPPPAKRLTRSSKAPAGGSRLRQAVANEAPAPQAEPAVPQVVEEEPEQEEQEEESAAPSQVDIDEEPAAEPTQEPILEPFLARLVSKRCVIPQDQQFPTELSFDDDYQYSLDDSLIHRSTIHLSTVAELTGGWPSCGSRPSLEVFLYTLHQLNALHYHPDLLSLPQQKAQTHDEHLAERELRVREQILRAEPFHKEFVFQQPVDENFSRTIITGVVSAWDWSHASRINFKSTLQDKFVASIESCDLDGCIGSCCNLVWAQLPYCATHLTNRKPESHLSCTYCGFSAHWICWFYLQATSGQGVKFESCFPDAVVKSITYCQECGEQFPLAKRKEIQAVFMFHYGVMGLQPDVSRSFAFNSKDKFRRMSKISGTPPTIRTTVPLERWETEWTTISRPPPPRLLVELLGIPLMKQLYSRICTKARPSYAGLIRDIVSVMREFGSWNPFENVQTALKGSFFDCATTESTSTGIHNQLNKLSDRPGTVRRVLMEK